MIRMTPEIVREAYKRTGYQYGRKHWSKGRQACPLFVCIVRYNGMMYNPPNITMADKTRLASLADDMVGQAYRAGFETGYNTDDPDRVHKPPPPTATEVGKWKSGYLDGVSLRKHMWGR